MHNCLSAGMARNWQFNRVGGVSFDSVPNQKRSRFHLCLLHFLFLTSSRRNWNWQGNYHFILNWSQSMWAGSKHRDMRGGKKRDGGEKKQRERGILGAFGDGSVICKTYRLKGGERWREGEKKEGETFWRLRCGCSLDVPLTGTRLGAARRRRFGFLFVWLRRVFPGLSRPGSETLWPTRGASP